MSYALGTSYPPTDINTLIGATALTGSRLPQDRFYGSASVRDRLDGHQVDQGAPYVVWTFGVLDETMKTALRTLCPGRSADVFIRTRNEDGIYVDYAAIMLWPVDLAARRQMGGKYTQVEFTFRNLDFIGELEFDQPGNSGYWFIVG